MIIDKSSCKETFLLASSLKNKQIKTLNLRLQTTELWSSHAESKGSRQTVDRS